MKDFFEILKENEIEIPEEKKSAIKTSFFENYKTVGEFEGNEKKLKSATDTIDELTKQVDELKESGKDVETLKSEIDKYKEAEEQRKAEEESNKKIGALKNRFSVLKGEYEYLNEATEKWIFDNFSKAAEVNEGKSDKEIFEEITKGKDIFKNPNTKFEMPPVGATGEKTKLKSFF